MLLWYNVFVLDNNIKQKAIQLRKEGKTYADICQILKLSIPKSTLSYWFREIILSDDQKARINSIHLDQLAKNREKAVRSNKLKRNKYLARLLTDTSDYKNYLENNSVSKIALAVLYAAEGSKSPKGYVDIGNSDPEIIKLFLKMFRQCYPIDENKFRCTVQCRADQNTDLLEKFWSLVTGISRDLFYKSRIDPRTLNRPTRKQDYKGVCRINYFSAEIDLELKFIVKSLCKGL